MRSWESCLRVTWEKEEHAQRGGDIGQKEPQRARGMRGPSSYLSRRLPGTSRRREGPEGPTPRSL